LNEFWSKLNTKKYWSLVKSIFTGYMDFDFDKLEKILNIKIENRELFITAFTHRSYLNEHSAYKNPSNERLEFLGDAVLQLLSSEYLFNTYPNSPEGDLTNYRSAVVCTPSIGEEARRLGYGELLLLSNGEESTGGRDREYILANTFEAVLGALFFEKGIDFCREFVNKNLLYKIDDLINKQEYKDAKSLFQELAQEKTSITPVYNVLESWGPDHEKTFKVGVFLGDKLWGTGEGRSKQKAEQQAAVTALKALKAGK
jgi:ribonuclease III